MIIQTILVIHDRSQLSICFLFAFFSSKLNRFHVINNIRKIMLSKLDRFYGFLGYFFSYKHACKAGRLVCTQKVQFFSIAQHK